MSEMLNKKDVLDAIEKKMKVVNEADGDADVVLGLAAAMSTVKQMQAAPVMPAEKQESSYNSIKTELDCVSRQAVLEVIRKCHCEEWVKADIGAPIEALQPVNPAEKEEPCEDMGEVSDGYHTFNQLYHQRAVLFATIVNQNKDKSWKSFKHSDGNYCFDSNGEWFIVGIDTPQGSYTYHYAKDYWDIFDCEELERGKEWDGHTEEDVTRLLSLEQEPKTGHWIDHQEDRWIYAKCSECGTIHDTRTNYCPYCGSKMQEVEHEAGN